MRALSVVAGLFLFLALAAYQPAKAQFVVGAQTGYNLDVRPGEGTPGAMLVGGQAQFMIEPLPLVFNPSVDVFMTGEEEFSALQFDANVLVPFLLQAEWVTPYIGGGLAITRLGSEETQQVDGGQGLQQTTEVVESSTDYGGNIIAGVLLGAGPLRPFVTVRSTLGRHAIYGDDTNRGGEGYSVSAGVLVRFSQ